MNVGYLGTYLLGDICDHALEDLDVDGDADLSGRLGLTETAGLDLVIAAYDSKRGVMAQSLKVLCNLGDYVVEHSLVGHNEGASKGEVEEYDKTELVTDIEEIVVGIVAAAPYADSVEVSEYASFKKLSCALLGTAGEDVILGNVVCAHSEELDTVALVSKALAPSVLFSDELEGAKTYTKALGIEHLVVLHNVNGEGIKRLIAEASGPPELGIGNLALLVGGEEIALAVGSKHADGYHGLLIGIYEGSDEHSAAHVSLLNLEVGDASGVLGKERDASPDTHVGKEGTPVPAEHAVGLTDIAEAVECLNGVHKLKILTFFLYVRVNVSADNAELVLSVEEQVGNVKLIGYVHIVNVGDVHSVEIDVREGVYTLKTKDIGVLSLLKVKGSLELVIVVSKSQRVELIFAPMGILHKTCVEQEGVERAGDVALDLIASACHCPFSVKR